MVARLGAEHREDMHRLLHHALAPLEAQLGVQPYRRNILASRTAATSHRLATVSSAHFRAANAKHEHAAPTATGPPRANSTTSASPKTCYPMASVMSVGPAEKIHVQHVRASQL